MYPKEKHKQTDREYNTSERNKVHTKEKHKQTEREDAQKGNDAGGQYLVKQAWS